MVKTTRIKVPTENGGTHEIDYVTVNERVKEFRTNEKYSGFKLLTNILQLDENSCVIRAEILNAEGVLIATGTARETKEGNKMINKTSYVENCETSAWGRALANLGIGIDAEIASAEETINAVAQQINEEFINKEERLYLFEKFRKNGKVDEELCKEFIKRYGYTNTYEIIRKDYKKMIRELEKPVEPTKINEVEL